MTWARFDRPSPCAIVQLTGWGLLRIKRISFVIFHMILGFLETLSATGWSHEQAMIIATDVSPSRAKNGGDEGF